MCLFMVIITNSLGMIPMNQSFRTKIMSRAWAIFRATYHYPQIKFASIGRDCFAWALRQAWAEARTAARLAAIPAPVKVARIAALQVAIGREAFNDHYPSYSANVAAMRSEIAQLSN
jgi:hypothetical protein